MTKPIPSNWEAARSVLARASDHLWKTRHDAPGDWTHYANVTIACAMLDALACTGRYV